MPDLGECDVTLDSATLDELNSPQAKTLLDTIDSLRQLPIGKINLPQIVVVGDQSSGKSSVLEAISRVRFPTSGDICTRFATELVLRRDVETKISVRIDPVGVLDGSPRSQLFHRTSFNQDALPEIIKEATEKMGIRLGSKGHYSQNILRVGISGPDIYQVTLVDLPGFFHSETADQSEKDKEIAIQLAEHYMEQPNSIILAVVSANQNLANQIVAKKAKQHDPQRERTLGVITKPDLAGPEDEKKCLQLVRGHESMHKLRLGWHVIRNRPEGREDMTADERDAEEERFLRRGAWSSIDTGFCGIVSLRKKLSRVLLEHIQKTLPGLIREIESTLSSRQRALEQLGKPRSEPEDLRTYLLEIAERFQRLALGGRDGRYGDKFFGDLYDNRDTRKLRAVLRRLNSAFYATLVTKGVDREVLWEDDDDEGVRSRDGGGGFSWIRDRGDVPGYLRPFLDLFDEFPEPAFVSEMDLCEELEKLAAANQGTEFPGLPNGELGLQLFKMQARPWRGIANCYVERAVDFAKAFVEEIFMHIIGQADRQTINAILASCVASFFEEKRRILQDKLEEILRPYAAGYGPPLDAEFYTTMSSRTIERQAGSVANLLEETFPAAFTDKGSGRGLTREKVEQAIRNTKKDRASEFGNEKVIDMTMTHFQISLKTFAQNVVNLVVENCLISDIPTILTPSMVIRMSEERLRELASESEDLQVERMALQDEVKLLRAGLKECQRSRPNEKTVLPNGFLNTPSSSSTPEGRSPSRTISP